MKKQINQSDIEYYVETSQYFTDENHFFISSAGKIESVKVFKIKLFE